MVEGNTLFNLYVFQLLTTIKMNVVGLDILPAWNQKLSINPHPV